MRISAALVFLVPTLLCATPAVADPPLTAECMQGVLCRELRVDARDSLGAIDIGRGARDRAFEKIHLQSPGDDEYIIQTLNFYSVEERDSFQTLAAQIDIYLEPIPKPPLVVA